MRTHRTDRLLKDKLKSISALKLIRAGFRKSGKKVVFTNGCFDLLHYGHVQYLEDARRLGDILIVAVNSDVSVRRIKGDKRPIVGENDRARVIAALESVDYVTIFDGETPVEVIGVLKPDILVKGADWKKECIVGKDIVEAVGGMVKTIHCVPGRSTTTLIRKIVETS